MNIMKYVKLKTIKKVEGKDIYHLTIKNNHNFFGNNLLLHNCDYFSNPDNDGNIGICLRNENEYTHTKIEVGERIAQGIFIKFLPADNVVSDNERSGGIGSTDKK
jgi:hypothetical protein